MLYGILPLDDKSQILPMMYDSCDLQQEGPVPPYL